MVTESVVNFVEVIRQHRVLEPDQLDELARLQAQFPEPRSLAKQLMQRNWMTPYQINQLMAGRGADLVLGQYVILERLGEGGMGQVFIARHRRMDRVVALKVIRKDHLNSPDAVKRFKREMQATATLSHPNIVMALDADQAGDIHFFVMEYVDGIDLSSLVKRMGPPPVAQAFDYMRQAAVGLQHAHEKGMVHRDIKPSNLLVSRPAEGSVWGSTIKILDMGVARLLDTGDGVDSVSALTKEGRVVGTPDYMAPEQAANSAKADIRADLYSLGCTFYHLLVGQPPFPGGTPMEKLLKHRIETAKPVESLRPDVPPAVAALIQRLMAKKPEDRYQTPADLVKAMDSLHASKSFHKAVQAGLLRAQAVPRIGPASDVTAPLTVPIPPRRSIPLTKRTLLIGAGAAALMAIGLVVLILALVSMGSKKPTRRAGNDDPVLTGALADLSARAADAKGASLAAVRRDVLRFRLEHAGSESGLEAARLLMRMPSPLDDLKREAIPAGEREPTLPDLVAVLGERRQRHWSYVRAVAASPDGKWIASGGNDAVVRLWDAATMQEKGVLSNHNASVYWVAFMPDSKTLLSAGGDGMIRFWDDLPTKPKERPELAIAIPAATEALALSPTGLTLAHSAPTGAGLGQAVIRLYDLEGYAAGTKPRLKATVSRHTKPLRALAFSLDGQTLASAGNDQLVVLWNLTVAPPKEQRVIHDSEQAVDALAFSRDLLAAGGNDYLVRLYELGKADAEPRVLKGHGGAIHALAFAPAGGQLVSASADRTVRIWELATPKEPMILRKGQVHYVNALAAVGGPTPRLVTAGQDTTVRLWTLDGTEPRELPAPLKEPMGMTTALAFTPDLKGLISANDGNEPIRLWSLNNDAKMGALNSQPSIGFWLAAAQDGQTLASCQQYGPPHVQLWRLGDAGSYAVEDLPAQPPPSGPGGARATALALSPDGKTVATGQADGSVRLCAVGGGKPWRILTGHPAAVSLLAFAPDGKTVASADDKSLRLWSIETDKELTPPLTGIAATALAFTPDGKSLATGIWEGSGDVRLYEWAGGALKPRPLKWQRTHTRPVTGLAFTPDGGRLISSGQDGQVILHGAGTGSTLAFWRLPGLVRGIQLASDGRHLATGNGNGTVYVFHVK